MGIGSESEHLCYWFLDLSSGRGYTSAAGMAGVFAYPNRITWSELQAWAFFHDPTRWEISALKRMDAAWMSVKKENKPAENRHQSRGEYCAGRYIEKCEKVHGAALDYICSTCPD